MKQARPKPAEEMHTHKLCVACESHVNRRQFARGGKPLESRRRRKQRKNNVISESCKKSGEPTLKITHRSADFNLRTEKNRARADEVFVFESKHGVFKG